MPESAVQKMFEARADLREDYNGSATLMSWMIVIDQEAQDAARALRKMLLDEDRAPEECATALARLGAAAIEALVALDESGLPGELVYQSSATDAARPSPAPPTSRM